jgi:hypothetical protein
MMTEEEVRRIFLWLCERLMIDPQPDRCDRCGHSGYFHRLDSQLDMDPTDPEAVFRCTFPMPDGPAVPLCICPDYVEPGAPAHPA